MTDTQPPQQEPNNGGVPSTAEDSTQLNGQIVALTRATLEELSPAELFLMFDDMDTEVLGAVGAAHRLATLHNSAPKPEPEVTFGEDDENAIEALAMRIVGNLAAGEYMIRGGLFDTWDGVVDVVYDSLLQGSLGATVVCTYNMPSGFSTWLNKKREARQRASAE